MAERPVFVPVRDGVTLFKEVPVSFRWHPGMSATQKKKNVKELHLAAHLRGFRSVMEVSSKSDEACGRSLSAFSQEISTEGRMTTIECAFQGSKVFRHGGPFRDLYEKTSLEAKKDIRLRESGSLISFFWNGDEYPLEPKTAFYDWLYVNALYPLKDSLIELEGSDAFTDIEFNPARSINCQARSIAIFCSLKSKNQLDDAVESFGQFMNYYINSGESALGSE